MHTDFVSFVHQEGTTNKTGGNASSTIPKVVVVTRLSTVCVSMVRAVPRLRVLPLPLAGTLINVYRAPFSLVPASYPRRGQWLSWRPLTLVGSETPSDILNEIHLDSLLFEVSAERKESRRRRWQWRLEAVIGKVLTFYFPQLVP